MTPPTVPGFRPLAYLGGGSTFQVWEARPIDDIIPLVIKLPRPDALGRKTTLTLLHREARAGLTVRHPRLVRVLQSHLTADPPFVVFPLVPGESLRDRLKRRGRLSVRGSLWAVRQTAEALAALHRAGFVHADVKPGNILATNAGEVTLIDLGFAHKPGENRELLKAGFVMGTANYVAPELCRHPPREGPAADVFALGVTLFECLTGRLPYRAASAEEALRLRRSAQPRDLGTIRGDWSAGVVEVVRAMLASDPRDRPTAARLVRMLMRLEIETIRQAAGIAAQRPLR